MFRSIRKGVLAAILICLIVGVFVGCNNGNSEDYKKTKAEEIYKAL